MTIPALAHYSIGIDLGTTNTVLAFVPLTGDVASQVFAIPQLASAIAIEEAASLPSFLFLPEAAGPAETSSVDAALQIDERWVVGRFARDKAADIPGRVVHSAKSWLTQHSADRSARFLPWGSDEVERDDKLSPVAASALILHHLREAWNDRFSADGDDATFDRQAITITVPASFDAAAQDLTLQAARAAGYPNTVRLLEEPQAALYRWLELHEAPARCILVVDVGGGTSDFSLFSAAGTSRTDGRMQRIAVSEHILLGGDNMDLALAHRLESQLPDAEALSSRQWGFVVGRCRDMKEAALSTDGPPGEAFSVAIPGRGSSLIATTRSAQLTRAEIEALVLDGFFPACGADEYPLRAAGGLREFGLPYARDPAITRHLADFLHERPAVDGVLFNGGVLSSPRIAQRISEQIGAWQSGALPTVLQNIEPEIAVARGAARFGRLVHAQEQRIEAGTAQAIFLEAHAASARGGSAGTARSLICVLPHGAQTEQTFAIDELALEVRINRLVRFETYASVRRTTDRAGDIVPWNERDFRLLPALETSIDAPIPPDAAPRGQSSGEAVDATIPIRLTARSSELGRLEIACVSTDPKYPARWPLAFDLRTGDGSANGVRRADGGGTAAVRGPNVALRALESAQARITQLFGQPLNSRDRLRATRLLKSIETIVQLPKSEWNIVLVRSLWATLAACMPDCERSVEHEEAWLILAGFFLRPGFGAAQDDARIDRLWTLHDTGFFSAQSVAVQRYVLWRRVAGGLSAERQERVLEPERAQLRDNRAAPELVLLAGSLERIGLAQKTELIERFSEAAAVLERERKHNAHFLTALGYLLNRSPLYAGPEAIVPADCVARTFERLANFDWDGPRRRELQTLFLRAARIVDNRSVDLARSLRNRISDKLEHSGVPPAKLAALKQYLPMQRAERAGSFGEALPPGFVLREPAPV